MFTAPWMLEESVTKWTKSMIPTSSLALRLHWRYLISVDPCSIPKLIECDRTPRYAAKHSEEIEMF